MRLARRLKDTERISAHHESIHVLRRFCELIEESVVAGEAPRGFRQARLAFRLARRLEGDFDPRVRHLKKARGVSEPLTLAAAQLATVYCRLRSQHAKAHSCLDFAEAVCPEELQGDLARRRAWLYLYEHRYSDALESAQRAVEISPGGEQRAKAYTALGVANSYLERGEAALAAFQLALKSTDRQHSNFFLRMYNVIRMKLENPETNAEELREGLAECHAVRGQLSRSHQLTRARIWWTIGLIHRRLNEYDEAWTALNYALASFKAMKREALVVAVVTDMVTVALEYPLKVRVLCGEIARDMPTLSKVLSHITNADDMESAAVAIRAKVASRGVPF